MKPLLSLFILCDLFTASLSRSASYHHESMLNNKRIYGSDLSIEIPMLSTLGSYLVPLEIGEPPQTLHLIADTGSDATWLYCDPRPCRLNNYSYSPCVFDPSRSSTFAPLRSSSGEPNRCNYTILYDDGSSTSGFWATETVTFRRRRGPDVKLNDFKIGCSSGDLSDVTDADGILGLAGALPPAFTKFSYVLYSEPNPNDGLLTLGDENHEITNTIAMQYTDLEASDRGYNHVKISNVFVGDTWLDVRRSAWEVDDVTLDTGTELTYVPGVVMEAIREAFGGLLGGAKKSAACIDFGAQPGIGAYGLPRVAIEFEGGARLRLSDDSLWEEDEEGRLKCLVIRASGEGEEGWVIGNVMQRGHVWEYDLLNRRVGFAPLKQYIYN